MDPTIKRPSDVYIGREEAARLVGPQGKLVDFLIAAHSTAHSSGVLIVYVNDEHDPEKDREHLNHFGLHAIYGSQGAQIISPFDEMAKTNPNVKIVKGAPLDDIASGILNDQLDWRLERGCFDGIRVGVIECWTDAKVYNMIGALKNYLGAQEVATCAMLTASNSNQRHEAALQNIALIHGASVFESPLSFLEWLSHDSLVESPLRADVIETCLPDLKWPEKWSDREKREASTLLHVLTPDCQQLFQLGGGYSGCLTLRVTTSAGNCVVKIGNRDEIAAEYNRHYSMSQGLRGHVPKLSGHVEGDDFGGFSMTVVEGKQKRNTAPITLQSLWQRENSSPMKFTVINDALTVALNNGLGAAYGTAGIRTLDLFKAYCFTNNVGTVPFADAIVSSAISVACESGYQNPSAALQALCGDSIHYEDPVFFYKEWLPGKQLLLDVPESLVHADLNLQNILLCEGMDGLAGLWLIDFARLSRLPVFTDFAKIENDMAYILTHLSDKRNLTRRVRLHHWTLTGNLDLDTYDQEDELSNDEYYYLIVLKHLRQLMLKHIDDTPDMQLAYRTAQLRYAAHTLSFDEPNRLQRALALVGCGILCKAIYDGTQV